MKQKLLSYFSIANKLSVGDTFFCSLIIEGQPLYLNQLQHEKTPPAVYICGKQGAYALKYWRTYKSYL